ncbi:MAG: conjugal transfer protein [Actinobacteria bacterium]|nr:conjugal transfer protein [Actinomycetota bacterium]
MVTQQERRTDPYPLTWEIPLAILGGSLLALVLGAHVGRGLANLAAGAGWRWPTTAQLFRSAIDVIQGDAGAGLSSVDPLAEPDALLAWVLAVELVVMATYLFLTWLCLRRWGPTRTLGVATVDEARQLLGRQRLFAARRVIRPDLYGRKAKR